MFEYYITHVRNFYFLFHAFLAHIMVIAKILTNVPNILSLLLTNTTLGYMYWRVCLIVLHLSKF